MTLKHTEADFRGQHIFVGLDIGKKSWKTSIMTEELEHKTFTQVPHVEVLVNYLHRTFPGATYHCVYEAGFCGFWIYEQLTRYNIDCIVVNPADVPTKHRERAFKSNRVDARKLARSLRNGDLDPLYIPSRAAQEDRTLVRTRQSLVNEQTRCKNQIKSMLSYYGVALPEGITDKHWSKRYLTFLEQITMERASGDHALKLHLAKLSSVRLLLADVTTTIRRLAEDERYQSSVQYLISVPGVSTLTAMILLTELIDINRFHSLDDLACYCGLVPVEHSTGEEDTITTITSRRNPFLRRVLIESAWVAARKDPALLASFTLLSKRMPKNQAIVRIARKLLNRIRFVLKQQQYYHTSIAA